MKIGNLGTIRWDPFPSQDDVKLSIEAASNAVVRAFLQTGIPRPPQDLSVLEEARFLLRCASEIEHGLLIQYLYALYSLNVNDPTVGGWTAVLREIAVEEMGHLLTVQNLLIAIGGEPYFDRQYVATDPFPFLLEPLSRGSLAKYVTTESPGVENISDLARRGRVAAIEAIAMQAAANPTPNPIAPLTIKHVGGLYAWLYWLFLPSDKIEGPWDDLPTEPFLKGRHLRAEEFTGLRNPRQAVAGNDDDPEGADWGFAGSAEGPILVRDISSAKPEDEGGALKTIFEITVQGEGFADKDDSHFERFLRVFDELEVLDAKGVKVSRPLATSPSVYRRRDGRTITHPIALVWAKLFNARYQMLLLKLSFSFSLRRNDKSQNHLRAALIRDAVDREMLRTLLPIADRLTHLPLKPRRPGVEPEEFAGPTFELPDEPLPTTAADQRVRLVALIQESADLTKELRDKIPTGSGPADTDLPTKKDDEQIFKPLAAADKKLNDLLNPAKK